MAFQQLYFHKFYVYALLRIKRFKERKTIKTFAIHIVPSSRVHDAVVLKGSDLPELLSVPTWQILGYNFNSSGIWTQIPIQIDEMHYQKWDIIKHVPDCRKVYFRMSYYILLIHTYIQRTKT